jgi:hypothetical protein
VASAQKVLKACRGTVLVCSIPTIADLQSPTSLREQVTLVVSAIGRGLMGNETQPEES